MTNPDSSSIFPQELIDRLTKEGILAVLTIEDPKSAAPLAEALVSGGIRAMELAYRTPATIQCLRNIRKAVPEMMVGIGTILNQRQLKEAQQEGAMFAVSPGYSPQLVEWAGVINFPYAPGVMTPSDIQQAVSQGCRYLKFFPAQTAGGIKHLNTMNAPFAHLGLRYIVLGGLTEANADEYIKDPSVSILGGSWIAPQELIKSADWNAIQRKAQGARDIWTMAQPLATA